MTELKPYLICKDCRHEDGWADHELCARFYFCGKYHAFIAKCKKRCRKLRQGLLKQLRENLEVSKND